MVAWPLLVICIGITLCAYDAETDHLAIITEQGEDGSQHDEQAWCGNVWV